MQRTNIQHTKIEYKVKALELKKIHIQETWNYSD